MSHTEGEVKDRAAKGLNDEFENAKVEAIDDEHDSELIAGARAHEGAPVAAARPAWWRAAWNTIEHKMDSQTVRKDCHGCLSPATRDSPTWRWP